LFKYSRATATPFHTALHPFAGATSNLRVPALDPDAHPDDHPDDHGA